jgi:hypothetical protein
LSESKYITFGTTVVNLAAVVAMSEQEFKSMFAGLLTTDINEAWKEVKKHKPKSKVKPITKEDIFNADGSVKKSKRKSNKQD